MKNIFIFLLFVSCHPLQAQSNIKYLEALVEKSFEQIDATVSKSNFKILKSNYVQSTSDTTLYGIEAEWFNSRNEIIILDRMMMYVPIIRQKDSIEVGKAKVLKVTVSLIMDNQPQAESILNSLKVSKYKKISGAIPIGNGLEIKYESGKYKLTYKKTSDEERHALEYHFIIQKKAYEIVDKKIYPKD